MESSEDTSRVSGAPAGDEPCSRCRLDDPDDVPCLRIYGLITSIAYQRARYCAERLYGALAQRFDPPLIKGMLDFEWDDFLTNERRVHGPRLYEVRSGVLVWDGDYFVGDDHDLVRHIAHDFVFSFPNNDASFFLHMVTEYHDYLNETKHLFATMDFMVGKRKVGSLMFELYSDMLPATCENFLRLVEGSASLLLEGGDDDQEELVLTYTGTRVHRIMREGWLQCGDVINVLGGGGHSAMGDRFFPDERCMVSHNRRGVLSMCNEGPHANASQFFITLAPNKWMDSLYVAFGQVVEGAQTLRLLEGVKTLYENPVVPIVITRCATLDPSVRSAMPMTDALPPEFYQHPSPISSARMSFEDADMPEWDAKGAVESVVDVRDVASLLYEERFLQGLYSLTVPEALVWRAFDASREQMDEELARRLLLWLARRAARESRNAEDRKRELERQVGSPEAAARAAVEGATAQALASVAASARERLARRAAEKVVTEALLADDDDAHYTLSAFLRLAAAVAEELADIVMHPSPEMLTQEEAARRIAKQLLSEVLSQASKGSGERPPGDAEQTVRDVLDRVLAGAEGIDPDLLGPAADEVRDIIDDVVGKANAKAEEAKPIAEDILGMLFGKTVTAADGEEEEEGGMARKSMSPSQIAENVLRECLGRAEEGLPTEIARELFRGVKDRAEGGEALYVASEILRNVLSRLEGPEAQNVLDAEAFEKLLGDNFDPGDDVIFAYSALIAREILKKARLDADERPWSPIVPLFAGLKVDTLDTEPLMQYEKVQLVRELLDQHAIAEASRPKMKGILLSRKACEGVVRGLLTQDLIEDVENETERQAREAFRQHVISKAREILQGAFELVAEIQWAAADVAFKYGVRTALPPSHIGFPPGDVRLLPTDKLKKKKKKKKVEKEEEGGEEEVEEEEDKDEEVGREKELEVEIKKDDKKKQKIKRREEEKKEEDRREEDQKGQKLERKFDPFIEKPPLWPPAIPGDDPSYYHPGLTGTNV